MSTSKHPRGHPPAKIITDNFTKVKKLQNKSNQKLWNCNYCPADNINQAPIILSKHSQSFSSLLCLTLPKLSVSFPIWVASKVSNSATLLFILLKLLESFATTMHTTSMCAHLQQGSQSTKSMPISTYERVVALIRMN